MGHSTVWRCDRCGATSEPSAGSDHPDGWREVDMTGRPDDPTVEDEDPFAADLCPPCCALLRAWLVDVS